MPFGASISRRGFTFESFSWFATADLHFECLLACAQREACSIEQTIGDVQIVLDAIVHHLCLSSCTDHDEDRHFLMFHLSIHANERLCPIIEYHQGPDRSIA